jgi:hypothetical protein
MSRISDREVALVLERAGEYCEACQLPMRTSSRGDYELHHRMARGMGGAGNRLPWIDTAANLVALHPACHARVHRNPQWARMHGYIVPFGIDPSTRSLRPAPEFFWLPG